MGTCWNCGRQVTLQEEQTRCDNCYSILFYKRISNVDMCQMYRGDFNERKLA
jgi:DNA-directed RNA polymerase subunit RPC12/RpoP